MGKEIRYSMGKGILEMASQPLRSRQDAILLLLYTIRMFEVDELSPENTDIKVVISINKMNRIFYILEDKIFSIQFPFNIEIQESKIIRIYDIKTGVDVDSMLISTLIRIFEKKENALSFDSLFEEIMYGENELQNIGEGQLWEIVKFISTYDLGYLRYDYDEKNQNGLLHPINHLDICLDTAATFKIGLEKVLDYEMFKDILDITTDCSFLKV